MASSSSMNAVVFREFGGPQLMRLEEVPMPVPSSGDVLLKVEAVAVNCVS
jgi:NADPH:quinone reductase-like Zn-dependent oxidoreductase